MSQVWSRLFCQTLPLRESFVAIICGTRGIYRHYNGKIYGLIEVILGRLEEEGRGIVRPWSPTLRLRWEWMVSVRREVIGKRVAKSTYSPLVMAVEVALVRWLAREGCRKLGWRDATWAGLEKSTGEEREPRPEETAVLGRRLPVGGFWREGCCCVVFWPPSCGGGGGLDLRLSWRLLGGLGRVSWALALLCWLLAPPSWISWRFIRSSTMEAIKAANSACGTPVAILELDWAPADCDAGGLCCSLCCSREISSRRFPVCWRWRSPSMRRRASVDMAL